MRMVVRRACSLAVATAFYRSHAYRVSEGWQVLMSLPSLGQEAAGRATRSFSDAESSALKLTAQYLFQYVNSVLRPAIAGSIGARA